MKDQKDTIKQVIDYIEDNLENHISLDTIAQKTGYSKFYLNRVFTRQTGITIHKYLQNRRLINILLDKVSGIFYNLQ